MKTSCKTCHWRQRYSVGYYFIKKIRGCILDGTTDCELRGGDDCWEWKRKKARKKKTGE